MVPGKGTRDWRPGRPGKTGGSEAVMVVMADSGKCRLSPTLSPASCNRTSTLRGPADVMSLDTHTPASPPAPGSFVNPGAAVLPLLSCSHHLQGPWVSPDYTNLCPRPPLPTSSSRPTYSVTSRKPSSICPSSPVCEDCPRLPASVAHAAHHSLPRCNLGQFYWAKLLQT